MDHRNNTGNGQTASESVRCPWTPPLATWMKLNFDGACDLKQCKVGLGAVIRDDSGVLRGAMAIPYKLPLSPLATEATALCHVLGVSKIEIEGDALSVLKALDSYSLDLSEIGAVVEEIKLLMRNFDMVYTGIMLRRQ